VRNDTPSLRREASFIDRRYADRRTHSVRALLIGSFMRRRHGPRRSGEAGVASSDFHHPQWFVVGLLILLLCVADALLTLTLIAHGALEANPLMARLVYSDARAFVTVKICLTVMGVVLLILTARVRAFGRFPVGVVLYAVLVAYVALVLYELSMLQNVGM
jgi:hypothetical protein